ncbi:MAG: Hsp20/alpha crystallin family protein [Lentisphaerae bacterium]|jgi:HSP20 family protein|nr:Hsp20/alpha crystallin family protein [Lentisphaerota bacterium]
MLWTWPTNRYGSMWSELDRLQRQMNRLFEPFAGGQSNIGSFPAVNLWTGEDQALLTAELPGIDPDKIEVTVKDNTVTIRGTREREELKEGETYLRQERGAGTFVRSISMPFKVDDAKISAQYQKGILQLTLPRAEADKPKKITVNAG